MKNKICIIGAGNLGLSLAKGLVDSGNYVAKDLYLTRRTIKKLDDLKSEGYNVSSNNIKSLKQAEIIIIAVLPQKINSVLNEIKNEINDKQLLISLASGVTIENIIKIIGSNIPIVRAMPNTAISIRQSMTCITTIPKWKDKLPEVRLIFNLVGQTEIIPEEKMTSATALCACGLAFFLRAIRAASQGGNEIDFHAGESLRMAAQTALGAAGLLLTNNSHPEDEIDKVTSPKGCTIAGLNEMEHNGFSSAFIKGITVSAEKAKDLY